MKLSVSFVDFWPGFEPADNFFFHLLSTRYRVEVVTRNPDIAIFSVFGDKHRTLNCKKYHYSGESRKVPDDQYNYSLTFDETSGRNFRLPLWQLYIDWFGQGNRNLVPLDFLDRRPARRQERFCNFIYSNNSGPRTQFLQMLNRQRAVDSPGLLHNNCRRIGSEVKDKLDAIRDYRFTIAFENADVPGYVTEKLLHPLAIQSVPIYWGCDEVGTDFNTKAFLSGKDFTSLESMADRVVLIDNDEELRQSIILAPIFNYDITQVPSKVLDFFERTL